MSRRESGVELGRPTPRPDGVVVTSPVVEEVAKVVRGTGILWPLCHSALQDVYFLQAGREAIVRKHLLVPAPVPPPPRRRRPGLTTTPVCTPRWPSRIGPAPRAGGPRPGQLPAQDIDRLAEEPAADSHGLDRGLFASHREQALDRLSHREIVAGPFGGTPSVAPTDGAGPTPSRPTGRGTTPTRYRPAPPPPGRGAGKWRPEGCAPRVGSDRHRRRCPVGRPPLPGSPASGQLGAGELGRPAPRRGPGRLSQGIVGLIKSVRVTQRKAEAVEWLAVAGVRIEPCERRDRRSKWSMATRNSPR